MSQKHDFSRLCPHKKLKEVFHNHSDMPFFLFFNGGGILSNFHTGKEENGSVCKLFSKSLQHWVALYE